MGSNTGDRACPQARLGGHLLALVADRNVAALSAELPPLVAPAAPESTRADYGGVLAWLVTALADVAVARLGPAQNGESFVLEIRTTAGRTLGAGELAPRQGRVGSALLALLAGDRDTARAQLAAAEREPDPGLRTTTLVEALIWLHTLLDADTPAFPDPPPE